MNNQSNIERLIDAAAKYGYTEEQIILICDEIGRASYEQLAQEVDLLLSPEEKHAINNLNDEEKERVEVERLYQEKTGKNAADVIGTYLSRHIDEFIEDHRTGSTARRMHDRFHHRSK